MCGVLKKRITFFHPNSLHLLELVEVCWVFSMECQSLTDSTVFNSNYTSFLHIMYFSCRFCIPLYSLETIFEGVWLYKPVSTPITSLPIYWSSFFNFCVIEMFQLPEHIPVFQVKLPFYFFKCFKRLSLYKCAKSCYSFFGPLSKIIISFSRSKLGSLRNQKFIVSSQFIFCWQPHSICQVFLLKLICYLFVHLLFEYSLPPVMPVTRYLVVCYCNQTTLCQ